MERTTCNNPVIKPPVSTCSERAGLNNLINLELIEELIGCVDVSVIAVPWDDDWMRHWQQLNTCHHSVTKHSFQV
jgi:hypothetical protein